MPRETIGQFGTHSPQDGPRALRTQRLLPFGGAERCPLDRQPRSLIGLGA